MPTKDELKAAIAAAVGEEAAQVAARLKALEDEVVALKDQVANGQAVTTEEMDEIIAGIRGIFTPA